MKRPRLPYLIYDRDRHGNWRTYVRRDGRKKRLREQEGTAAFIAEYQAALAELETNAPPIGASKRKVKPGTVRALILHYQTSRAFKDLAETSRSTRRRVLDRLDQKIGDHAHTMVTAAHIKTWRDAPDGPEAGNNIVKTLRAVYATAVEDGLADINPAALVKYRKSANPEGYATWTRNDVEQFIKVHPRGTMAHKALCLFLFTGQRLSDVRRLGPQHARDGWLIFTQHKNRTRKPVRIEIPIIEPLQNVLETPPSHQMAFITSERGVPFQSDASFGNRFIKWCREAGIDDKSAHGLRKGCASILAELGCTDREIMAITGHTTSKEVDRYTRAAERKRMAATLTSHQADLARLVEQKRDKSVPPARDSVPPARKALK